MKPTKEQIEAALRHSDYLTSCREKSDTSRTLLEILSAAYRELLAENENLKKELAHITDLLDAHFDNGGAIAGLATTNKARKLLAQNP